MYSGIDLNPNRERATDRILLKVMDSGKEIHSGEMPIGIYGNQSGVLTLLKLDPESVIQVCKPDGTMISYEHPKV